MIKKDTTQNTSTPKDSFRVALGQRRLGAGNFQLNPNFLQELTLKEKRAFALLLKLKHLFVNGRIYDYTPLSLSKKTRISIYLIKTHIDALLKLDMVYFEGNILMLRSLDNIIGIRRTNKHKITVSNGDTLNNIVTELNFMVLKQHFERQDYRRTIKSNEIKARTQGGCISIKEYKAHKELVGSSPKLLHGGLIDYNILGLRKLSEILNCSRDKSSQFLKELESQNKIKTNKCITVFSRKGDSRFNGEEYKKSVGKSGGYLYSFGNIIFCHMGTSIEVISETAVIAS